MSIVIEWDVLDRADEKDSWKASTILASVELKNGLCSYEYSQVMSQYLYQPEIYGRINIELVAKFKSSYALALYENCIRYQNLPQTPWFPIAVFRPLMGVEEGKYKEFKAFKRRVLDIAIDEVNNISPIKIVPEIDRRNQSVTRVRFLLDKNGPIDAAKLMVDQTVSSDVKTSLIEVFGFSDEKVKDILGQYEVNYVREKIDQIRSSKSFLSGKIEGVAGYLIDSLRHDYKANKSSKTLVAELRLKKVLEEKAEESHEEDLKIVIPSM